MQKGFNQGPEYIAKPESSYSPEEQKERDVSIRKLQGIFRQKQAYDRWFRVKLELTAKAGVMMALAGTAQGYTGWYLNPSSQSVFYYRVLETGKWVSDFDHVSEDDYKDIASRLRHVAKEEGIAASVPIDLEQGSVGEAGWYCNQKMKCAYYDLKDGNLVERPFEQA